MKAFAGRLMRPAARIRLTGSAALIALVLLTALGAPWTERLQGAWFDAHQALSPRVAAALPVTVIAIDQKSLRELGQWPWPRTQLARLIDIVDQGGAAVIGIDLLMPEPDALSPEQLAAQEQIRDPGVVAGLLRLPAHDAILARALAAAPAVLALAGTPEPTRMLLRVAPILVHAARADEGQAPVREPPVPRYGGALTSIAVLNQQARGWGLVSVETTRGIIRRIPLVASIDGTLVPALALEMVRVAQQAPALHLTMALAHVRGVSAGTLDVPTERDGAVRVHFAPPESARFLSAVDVLQARVDPARFRGQLVLVGLTGMAMQESQDTPIGVRMSGTEIHAQLLENLVGGNLLRRPPWAPGLEALALALLGTLLLWATPRWGPLQAALLPLGGIAVLLVSAFAAFRWQRLLFDAATPSLGLLLLFGLMAVLTVSELTRQRRVLKLQVQAQRERSARIAGELQAAQRVQAATLPSDELLAGDRRVDLHAVLEPAREVGGDLYDFFMLDDRRLFLLVGDVAGKGLSASMFMAVSKALYKSAMLRAPGADLGAVMSVANAEVSRDNPEMLFVTAFAAILDLEGGELHYCNAGHDNPLRLHPSRAAPLAITDGDGPPLCALADYAYQGAACRLLAGELLCFTTDGVAEARSGAGELFGHERVRQALLAAQASGAGARETVEMLRLQVHAFGAGAEPADDLTILALRWNGAAAAEAAAA